MKKRYSPFIKPLQIVLDLLLINCIIYFIYDREFLNFSFLSYITLFWLIISYFLGFYKVYRHSKVFRLFTILGKQFLVFFLGYFAYFGVFKEGQIIDHQFFILAMITISVSLVKILNFILLKKYRSLGNNLRSTIVLGFDESSKKVIKIFNSKSNLGYKFLGFFSNKVFTSNAYLGKIDEYTKYIKENEVDEVYCSLTSVSANKIKEIKKYTTENDITLKLIPDTIELYSKNQSVEYYDDSIMVLNVKKLPFEFSENFYIKRIFDILFSLFVCIFLLTWLIPVLWVMVKLESKGPLIFKQPREGLNGAHFICYKFRSMRFIELASKVHTSKNDSRVTKVGAFLRKSSMDELPQFFNVLLGDMSVVGPRPHIESLSIEYQKDVEDYLKRHLVKPGVTGLAQVSGYRGEVRKKSDIKNRVRLDIFYIENWSFFLDLKIIIKTILNVFKGEEKAY